MDYSKLVNKSGTIYRTDTGAAYSNPDQLATDLGVSSKQINWGNIKADPNYSFAPASQPSASPSTFSFGDKSTFDQQGNQVTNSSTPVDEAVDNLGGSITKTVGATDSIQALLDTFKKSLESSTADGEKTAKVYEERQKKLEERRAAELERLNAEYDTQKGIKENEYQAEIAPFKQKMQFLQDTPYGPNAQLEENLRLKLDGLARTHKLEMDNLFNQRQSFISQAQASYEDADFKLAEEQIKNANDLERKMYDRQMDYLNLSLKFEDRQRARQKEEFEAQQKVFEFNADNGIKQPYFTMNGTVFNSQTLEPEYENVNGTMVRISDGKKYANPAQFFQDTGISSFNQIQELNGNEKAERDLVADMQKKYIDAGISLNDNYDQALAKVQGNSKIYRQQTRLSNGPGTDENDLPTPAKVKNLLFGIKNSIPGTWWEQWDYSKEYLQDKGLNWKNYDKELWEIFHPEGLKGYEQMINDQELN